MEQMPNRIRELRKARGFMLEQLANRIGCSVTQMSDLERGMKPLSLHWMKVIARTLKVRPADLLNEEDNSRSLTAAERELVDLYGQADDPQKAQLLQMARILVGGATVTRRRAANA
jgi:transcriptional regulator with XRE-family HTH domain